VFFIADNVNTGSKISTITKIDSDYHDSFMIRGAKNAKSFWVKGAHLTKMGRSTPRETIKKMG
jgi:hypothetical protein